MNRLERIRQANLKKHPPTFKIGDTVRVHVKVFEGEKERIQVFEGSVIARRGSGISETFTVRKMSFGVGVERIFPIHSPSVAKVEVMRKGHVRRAKLYYLRGLRGKYARVTEREFLGEARPAGEAATLEPSVTQEVPAEETV